MNKVILSVFILCSTLSWGQAKKFHIKGNIIDPTIEGKVFFSYKSADRSFFRDSVDLKSGKFDFEGTVLEPTEVQLGLRRNNGESVTGGEYVRFFVYDSQVNITIPTTLNEAIIDAGNIQKEFIEYQKVLAFPNEEISRLNKLFNDSPNRKEKYFKDSMSVAYAEVQELTKEIQRSFIKEYPSSYFCVSALRNIAGSYFDPKEIEPLFLALDTEWENATYYKELRERIELVKKTAIGVTAPEFELPTPEGTIIKLSNFKGKYVFIDFWASWCGPCRNENPHVVDAYKKYNPLGLEIIGISLDEASKRQAWLDVIKEDGLVWTQVSDLKGWKSPVADSYGIKSIPQNFLINPEGKIVAANLRGKELLSTFSKFLNK